MAPVGLVQIVNKFTILEMSLCVCRAAALYAGASTSSSIVDRVMARHAQHVQQHRLQSSSHLPASLARLLPETPGKPALLSEQSQERVCVNTGVDIVEKFLTQFRI